LIGISMGGYVAIDVALKLGKQVKKLVLINTTSNSVNPDTLNDRKRGIELAQQNKLEQILKLSEGFCYFKPQAKWINLEIEMAREVGRDAYIRQQKAIMYRKKYTNDLSEIESD